MSTEALIGHGSIFGCAEVNPAVYAPLGEVNSITPPNETVDMIDATHMQSPGRMREFIAGLIDPGECAVEINYIPGGATDERLRAIKTAGVAVPCRITYPNGASHSFHALLSSYAPTDTVADKMTASLSWRVTGPVVAAGPGSP